MAEAREQEDWRTAEVVVFACYQSKDVELVDAWRDEVMDHCHGKADQPFDVGAVSTLHKEADEANLHARGVVQYLDTRSDEVVERVARAFTAAVVGVPVELVDDHWSLDYDGARAVLASLLTEGIQGD